MSVYHRIPLQPGDRIRMDVGTPIRTVKRVTPCAAYVSGEPRDASVKCDDCKALDKKGSFVEPCGQCRVFVATGAVEAISVNALVFRE